MKTAGFESYHLSPCPRQPVAQSGPQLEMPDFSGLGLDESGMQQPQQEQSFWQQNKKTILAVLAALGIGGAAVATTGA